MRQIEKNLQKFKDKKNLDRILHANSTLTLKKRLI